MDNNNSRSGWSSSSPPPPLHASSFAQPGDDDSFSSQQQQQLDDTVVVDLNKWHEHNIFNTQPSSKRNYHTRPRVFGDFDGKFAPGAWIQNVSISSSHRKYHESAFATSRGPSAHPFPLVGSGSSAVKYDSEFQFKPPAYASSFPSPTGSPTKSPGGGGGGLQLALTDCDVLRGHSDQVLCLAFSPSPCSSGSRSSDDENGVMKIVASGSSDCTVIIWDIMAKISRDGSSSGKPIKQLVEHETAVQCIAFSTTDTTNFCSGSADGRLILWRIIRRSSPSSSVSSPESDIDDVVVINAVSAHENCALGVKSVSYSADGKTIVSCGGDGVCKLWSASTGDEIPTAPLQSGMTNPIAAGAASSSTSSSPPASPNTRRNALLRRGAVFSTENTKEGNDTLVSFYDDGTLHFSSARDGTALRDPIPCRSRGVAGIAVSPEDSSKIVTVCTQDDSCSGHLWNTEINQRRPLRRAMHTWKAAKKTTDGDGDGDDKNSTASSPTNSLRMSSSFSSASASSSNGCSSVAFSSTGDFFVTGSTSDNTVSVWNAKSGALVMAPITGHGAAVTAVAVAPSSSQKKRPLVASASRDGTVRIWHLRAVEKRQPPAWAVEEQDAQQHQPYIKGRHNWFPVVKLNDFPPEGSDRSPPRETWPVRKTAAASAAASSSSSSARVSSSAFGSYRQEPPSPSATDEFYRQHNLTSNNTNNSDGESTNTSHAQKLRHRIEREKLEMVEEERRLALEEEEEREQERELELRQRHQKQQEQRQRAIDEENERVRAWRTAEQKEHGEQQQRMRRKLSEQETRQRKAFESAETGDRQHLERLTEMQLAETEERSRIVQSSKEDVVPIARAHVHERKALREAEAALAEAEKKQAEMEELERQQKAIEAAAAFAKTVNANTDKEEQAAQRIQCAWRQRKSRRELDRRRKLAREKQAELERLTEAREHFQKSVQQLVDLEQSTRDELAAEEESERAQLAALQTAEKVEVLKRDVLQKRDSQNEEERRRADEELREAELKQREADAEVLRAAEAAAEAKFERERQQFAETERARRQAVAHDEQRSWLRKQEHCERGKLEREYRLDIVFSARMHVCGRRTIKEEQQKEAEAALEQNNAAAAAAQEEIERVKQQITENSDNLTEEEKRAADDELKKLEEEKKQAEEEARRAAEAAKNARDEVDELHEKHKNVEDSVVVTSSSRDVAALKIQCAWRQYAARKSVRGERKKRSLLLADVAIQKKQEEETLRQQRESEVAESLSPLQEAEHRELLREEASSRLQHFDEVAARERIEHDSNQQLAELAHTHDATVQAISDAESAAAAAEELKQEAAELDKRQTVIEATSAFAKAGSVQLTAEQAAQRIQCAWRRRQARREMERRRKLAREKQAELERLKAAAEKFERSLQQLLDLEQATRGEVSSDEESERATLDADRKNDKVDVMRQEMISRRNNKNSDEANTGDQATTRNEEEHRCAEEELRKAEEERNAAEATANRAASAAAGARLEREKQQLIEQEHNNRDEIAVEAQRLAENAQSDLDHILAAASERFERAKQQLLNVEESLRDELSSQEESMRAQLDADHKNGKVEVLRDEVRKFISGCDDEQQRRVAEEELRRAEAEKHAADAEAERAAQVAAEAKLDCEKHQFAEHEHSKRHDVELEEQAAVDELRAELARSLAATEELERAASESCRAQEAAEKAEQAAKALQQKANAIDAASVLAKNAGVKLLGEDQAARKIQCAWRQRKSRREAARRRRLAEVKATKAASAQSIEDIAKTEAELGEIEQRAQQLNEQARKEERELTPEEAAQYLAALELQRKKMDELNHQKADAATKLAQVDADAAADEATKVSNKLDEMAKQEWRIKQQALEEERQQTSSEAEERLALLEQQLQAATELERHELNAAAKAAQADAAAALQRVLEKEKELKELEEARKKAALQQDVAAFLAELDAREKDALKELEQLKEHREKADVEAAARVGDVIAAAPPPSSPLVLELQEKIKVLEMEAHALKQAEAEVRKNEQQQEELDRRRHQQAAALATEAEEDAVLAKFEEQQAEDAHREAEAKQQAADAALALAKAANIKQLATEETAAHKIQLAFRQRRARQELERRRELRREAEVIAEASAIREHELNTLLEDHSARKIQCLQRQRLARAELDRLKKEHSEMTDAALKIQCLQRQRTARAELDRLKKEHAELEDATVKIQSLQRQRVARAEFAKRKKEEEERRNSAALKLQCWRRQHLARAELDYLFRQEAERVRVLNKKLAQEEAKNNKGDSSDEEPHLFGRRHGHRGRSRGHMLRCAACQAAMKRELEVQRLRKLVQEQRDATNKRKQELAQSKSKQLEDRRQDFMESQIRAAQGIAPAPYSDFGLAPSSPKQQGAASPTGSSSPASLSRHGSLRSDKKPATRETPTTAIREARDFFSSLTTTATAGEGGAPAAAAYSGSASARTGGGRSKLLREASEYGKKTGATEASMDLRARNSSRYHHFDAAARDDDDDDDRGRDYDYYYNNDMRRRHASPNHRVRDIQRLQDEIDSLREELDDQRRRTRLMRMRDEIGSSRYRRDDDDDAAFDYYDDDDDLDLRRRLRNTRRGAAGRSPDPTRRRDDDDRHLSRAAGDGNDEADDSYVDATRDHHSSLAAISNNNARRSLEAPFRHGEDSRFHNDFYQNQSHQSSASRRHQTFEPLGRKNLAKIFANSRKMTDESVSASERVLQEYSDAVDAATSPNNKKPQKLDEEAVTMNELWASPTTASPAVASGDAAPRHYSTNNDGATSPIRGGDSPTRRFTPPHQQKQNEPQPQRTQSSDRVLMMSTASRSSGTAAGAGGVGGGSFRGDAVAVAVSVDASTQIRESCNASTQVEVRRHDGPTRRRPAALPPQPAAPYTPPVHTAEVGVGDFDIGAGVVVGAGDSNQDDGNEDYYSNQGAYDDADDRGRYSVGRAGVTSQVPQYQQHQPPQHHSQRIPVSSSAASKGPAVIAGAPARALRQRDQQQRQPQLQQYQQARTPPPPALRVNNYTNLSSRRTLGGVGARPAATATPPPPHQQQHGLLQTPHHHVTRSPTNSPQAVGRSASHQQLSSRRVTDLGGPQSSAHREHTVDADDQHQQPHHSSAARYHSYKQGEYHPPVVIHKEIEHGPANFLALRPDTHHRLNPDSDPRAQFDWERHRDYNLHLIDSESPYRVDAIAGLDHYHHHHHGADTSVSGRAAQQPRRTPSPSNNNNNARLTPQSTSRTQATSVHPSDGLSATSPYYAFHGTRRHNDITTLGALAPSLIARYAEVVSNTPQPPSHQHQHQQNAATPEPLQIPSAVPSLDASPIASAPQQHHHQHHGDDSYNDDANSANAHHHQHHAPSPDDDHSNVDSSVHHERRSAAAAATRSRSSKNKNKNKHKAPATTPEPDSSAAAAELLLERLRQATLS